MLAQPARAQLAGLLLEDERPRRGSCDDEIVIAEPEADRLAAHRRRASKS